MRPRVSFRKAVTGPQRQTRTVRTPLAPSSGSYPRPDSLADPVANAEVSPPVAIPVTTSLLAVAPPPNVAVLNISVNGSEHDRTALTFSGHCATPGVTARIAGTPRRRPALGLGDLANANGLLPRDIVALMHTFSRDIRDVCKWISELRRRVGEDLCLVIVDVTDAEIPWELVVLPEQAGMKAYLGAAVAVSRWGQVVDVQSYDDVCLEFDEVEHRGAVVGWVDTSTLASNGREQAKLLGLGERLETSADALLHRLQGRTSGCALVYIGAHGRYAPNLIDFAIGMRDPDVEGILLNPLAAMDLHLFRCSDAVVFLNVCHAGRAIRDARLGDEDLALLPSADGPDEPSATLLGNRLRGFPERFLAQGAKGVIATTGAIHDEEAADMAEWLFGRLSGASQPGGRPVPQLLREWRAHVRHTLPESWNDWTQQHNRQLLTACMYVYYGNPFVRLRIGSHP